MEGDDSLLAALGVALAPVGLDLLGVAPVERYDTAVPPPYALRRLMPEARSAIVIGNAGGRLWGAFRDHCARHPGHDRTPDPLDDFTRLMVEERAAPVLAGRSTRFLYPFRFPADPVSFVHLGECAGLGRRSLLGVLVHPDFGPWIALRAAILVPEAVAAARPADGFDPCPTCATRTCIAACPAGAVTGDGWNVARCAAHRVGADEACAGSCHARFECVLGRDHRYPPAALAYHQARARPLLASFAPGLPRR